MMKFASLPQLLSTIPLYYAHPYSAYERGLNEEQNRINQLPRKSFHYSSPRNYFRLSYLILQSSNYFFLATI